MIISNDCKEETFLKSQNSMPNAAPVFFSSLAESIFAGPPFAWKAKQYNENNKWSTD